MIIIIDKGAKQFRSRCFFGMAMPRTEVVDLKGNTKNEWPED